ncbi:MULTISPECIES: hypothetical protein [Microbispora]|uniref:hypothetical protein n=1 Tax=Microbispora TaxID=2005 RepID=UPI0003DC5B8A|nr:MULTISPECIES: hypothetical protein [Microbispora]ETK30557.1 hypothetical protein MPTA5024_39670 [Microbispora sp. ATCC PTA-5024]
MISRTFPEHRIIAYVDEAQFAPELTKPLNDVAIDVLGLLQPVDEPRPVPALRVRIRRTGDLAGGLVVAEFGREDVTVGVDKTLITEDLADFLSEAGTATTRDFIRRAR